MCIPTMSHHITLDRKPVAMARTGRNRTLKGLLPSVHFHVRLHSAGTEETLATFWASVFMFLGFTRVFGSASTASVVAGAVIGYIGSEAVGFVV